MTRATGLFPNAAHRWRRRQRRTLPGAAALLVIVLMLAGCAGLGGGASGLDISVQSARIGDGADCEGIAWGEGDVCHVVMIAMANGGSDDLVVSSARWEGLVGGGVYRAEPHGPSRITPGGTGEIRLVVWLDEGLHLDGVRVSDGGGTSATAAVPGY